MIDKTGKPGVSAAAAIGREAGAGRGMIPFYLILFYAFMEYGRPQTLLPFLRHLRLPAISISLLALFVILKWNSDLKDRQTTLFMLLLGLMIVHGPIAVNNYWALMVFIGMAMNFVFYLALIRFVDSPEKYEKLVRVWILVHVFTALIGIVKGGKGIGGFLGDENDLCMTLNMAIPFSFFLALYGSGKTRLGYFLVTCLFLFVIILTRSRGGFVGLVATGFYCWIRTKRKVMTGTVIAVLAAFALVMAPADYWDEMRSISEEGTSKGTGAARVYTWTIGWEIFKDHPIMGVGQGNFPWVFGETEREVMESDAPFRGRSFAGRAAHSIYFTMLPELGLIGTFMIFAMLFYSYKDIKFLKEKADTLSLKKHHAIAFSLEGALISYLVSGAFISTLYYPNLWFLFGFIASLKKIHLRLEAPAPSGT